MVGPAADGVALLPGPALLAAVDAEAPPAEAPPAEASLAEADGAGADCVAPPAWGAWLGTPIDTPHPVRDSATASAAVATRIAVIGA